MGQGPRVGGLTTHWVAEVVRDANTARASSRDVASYWDHVDYSRRFLGRVIWAGGVLGLGMEV